MLEDIGATEQPNVQDVKVTFSFPNVITIGHYEIYTGAKLKYIASNDNPSNIRAQYEGTRALLRAGVVHIISNDTLVGQEGQPTPLTLAEQLRKLVDADDQLQTPANVMNLIGIAVGAKVESETMIPTIFGVKITVIVTPNGDTR